MSVTHKCISATCRYWGQ